VFLAALYAKHPTNDASQIFRKNDNFVLITLSEKLDPDSNYFLNFMDTCYHSTVGITLCLKHELKKQSVFLCKMSIQRDFPR
jgi:hypothetical protein